MELTVQNAKIIINMLNTLKFSPKIHNINAINNGKPGVVFRQGYPKYVYPLPSTIDLATVKWYALSHAGFQKLFTKLKYRTAKNNKRRGNNFTITFSPILFFVKGSKLESGKNFLLIF